MNFKKWYSYCRVRSLAKFQSILYPQTIKKYYFRFWLQYYSIVFHVTWKIFSRYSTITKEDIFSFLAPVLLWCIGLRNNSIWLDSCRILFLATVTTTIWHGTAKKLNRYSTPTKINVFSGYSTNYEWAKRTIFFRLKFF